MIKISYIGIRKGSDPFRVVSSKNFRKELNELPAGRYRLTVERYRKNKSNPQLGYLFAGVYPLVLQGLIDAGWEITTIDEVDTWCKSMFANRDLINKHTGQVINVPGLKRDMTTIEMSTFTNQVRDWAAEFLGVNIPDPETNLEIEYK
jgi:hypothetical protein